MCGRFALTASPEQIALQFALAETPTLAPRYNIAPSQPVAAVRLNRDTGQRELTHFHWGLIPSWAKDPAIGYKMINARSETAAEKPSFRNGLKYRRCLVPVSGFYEWQKVGKGKQPHYIHLAAPAQPSEGFRAAATPEKQPSQGFWLEPPLLAIAGLWEHWQSADGSEIESCTLLTTTPNELMRPLHDRMPVIIHPADYALWLDPQQTDAAALQPLFHPFPAELMTAYPVSTLVNSPMNDMPGCVERLRD